MAERPKTVGLMQDVFAADGDMAHQRGRFSARIRSEGPRRQMQDFESWMKGELLWRNRKIY